MAILDFFNMYSRGGWTKLCAHPVIPKGTDWTKVWFNGLKGMTFPVVFRQERDGTGNTPPLAGGSATVIGLPACSELLREPET